MIKHRFTRRAWVLLALGLTANAFGCDTGPAAPVERSTLSATEASQYLAGHRSYFDESVEQFDGVPAALFKNSNGGFANTTVLEAPEGLIVVDTNLNHEDALVTARKIKARWDKPIIAVIYTHHHGDHINGSGAFLDEATVASRDVPVIASRTFPEAALNENAVVAPIMGVRALYMYGALLPESEQDSFHVGCCGEFRLKSDSYLHPTLLVDDGQVLDLGGLKLQFFITGGESASHMVIWLPESRAIVVGDELQGPTFPNLHSLRGTAPRDAQKWIRAIDRIRALEPVLLLPGHGPALAGGQDVQAMLTIYRDAIQYTHDQAVRLMNKGYTEEELALALPGLPAALQLDPWTAEVYGTLKHSVRSYYTSYVSWFSGDPVDLDPTPPTMRASRTVELMGGRDAVLAVAREALSQDDPQWAAELATLLVRGNKHDQPARDVKANAFRALAASSINTNWRGFYLTAALELEGAIDAKAVAERILGLADLAQLPTNDLLSVMRYRVDANAAVDEHLKIGFEVRDRNEQFTAELRNGILDIRAEPKPDDLDGNLSLDRATLDGLFSGRVNLLTEQFTDRLDIEGLTSIVAFFGYLDRGLSPVTLADH